MPPPSLSVPLCLFFVILAHSAAASSPGRDGSCGSDTHATAPHSLLTCSPQFGSLKRGFGFTSVSSGASDRRNGAPLGLHSVLQAAERLVLRCVTRADTLFSFLLFLSFVSFVSSVVCVRHLASLCSGCDAEFEGLLLIFALFFFSFCSSCYAQHHRKY